ncbi:ArsR/SmtB family transcription factor [Bythopirellula polymerisocia]|uniref:Putative HTH-type transcriptional regulator n=1 Tax=Bythopirellula polymerisocia TaxID=2528003 RepID=A0A5C6CYV9_9BACT|nr:metalloregulator ArsR/SmtB family transcription factor [Bythopirellula polymerisocia]TWU29812.1 putative HTH-type transcriptional regulator [Bythopirellula polymerisocia]
MAISTKKTRPLKPADMKALGQAAECLKTLAHPVRIRMVQLLLHGRYTVGELAEDCDVPDNVASEHLRLMQRCGFFHSEREGRKVYYQVAEPHLENLMACIESRFLERRK